METNIVQELAEKQLFTVFEQEAGSYVEKGRHYVCQRKRDRIRQT